ncbi:MAG: hypothetical protein P4L64_07585 [Caulobacteraceae bacterium]|nr:hypothetical protein [Caulobacteraceae bacterium]
MAGHSSPSYDPVQDLPLHAAAYHHFMLGVKWVAIGLGAFLTFAIMAFGTSAGILPGLICGALVLVIGIYAMRHGLAHSTESDAPPG